MHRHLGTANRVGVGTIQPKTLHLSFSQGKLQVLADMNFCLSGLVVEKIHAADAMLELDLIG
jgi:hypothetical protein